MIPHKNPREKPKLKMFHTHLFHTNISEYLSIYVGILFKLDTWWIIKIQSSLCSLIILKFWSLWVEEMNSSQPWFREVQDEKLCSVSPWFTPKCLSLPGSPWLLLVTLSAERSVRFLSELVLTCHVVKIRAHTKVKFLWTEYGSLDVVMIQIFVNT